MNSKIVLFSKTFCKKAEWLLNVPFHLDYCLILIYRLKVSDRAGFRQVTFGFHTNCCGGVSVFSLLKKC